MEPWDEPEESQPLTAMDWLKRRPDKRDVNPALHYVWCRADDDDDWRATARKAKESSRSGCNVHKMNGDWRATSEAWRNEKVVRKRKYNRSERGRRQGK